MSKWINNKAKIKINLTKDKPCHKLNYCPYGQLVEEYPISKRKTKYSCKTFGHDCPMFYQAEEIIE
jgi:hypothetical protein